MVRRHLEIMAFVSPRNARKLEDISSAAEFLTAAEQLFQAILDAFCRRILHRDISVNNILVANSQLVMIDWEIGRRFQEPWLATRRGTLTGTLDTMSVASLSNEDPLPHDDIESAVYVLLKVLTQTFVPPVNQRREWAETLKEEYCWDRPDVEPRMLRNLRAAMWRNNPYDISLVNRTQEMFRLSGHETRAQLVHALLSLPLPARRIEIGFDYDLVLSSLEELVEQAVAAVHSVDASSLFGSSAGGVVAPG
ncbi:hypothetical protein B0H11DRAFT_2067357 [Mycena galericulata]|nr:hypothetical protein B0H11DRAFT_2067357 [Mycena galericulata]